MQCDEIWRNMGRGLDVLCLQGVCARVCACTCTVYPAWRFWTSESGSRCVGGGMAGQFLGREMKKGGVEGGGGEDVCCVTMTDGRACS